MLDARLISATLAKFVYRPVVGDGEQPCCDTATVGFVAASPTPYVEEGPEVTSSEAPGSLSRCMAKGVHRAGISSVQRFQRPTILVRYGLQKSFVFQFYIIRRTHQMWLNRVNASLLSIIRRLPSIQILVN